MYYKGAAAAIVVRAPLDLAVRSANRVSTGKAVEMSLYALFTRCSWARKRGGGLVFST